MDIMSNIAKWTPKSVDELIATAKVIAENEGKTGDDLLRILAESVAIDVCKMHLFGGKDFNVNTVRDKYNSSPNYTSQAQGR